MIGGLGGWTDLTNASNVAELLATGRVGLYVQESLLDPRNNNEWGNPSSNATIDGVFGLTAGQLGNDEYEGDFYPPEAPGYWDPNATELDLNYPMAALPAANLPLPDATTVNLGGVFNSPDDWYTFFNDPNNLQLWLAYVGGSRQHGAEIVSPVFAPNGYTPYGTFTWDPNFLDSTYDGLRQMAIAGGGLCIDSPPGYVLPLAVYPTLESEYMSFIEQEINWANSQGLRSSVILDPYYDDSTYASDVKAFVGTLETAGALPGQFIVENYNPGALSTLDIGSDTDPNSLAGVALWLAENVATYKPLFAAAPSTGGAGTEQRVGDVGSDESSGTGELVAPPPDSVTVGSDTIQAEAGTSGRSGAQTVTASGSNGIFAGGTGTFNFSATGMSETVSGGFAASFISVGGGNNLVYGGAGPEATSNIYTSGGNDTVSSGCGDATIWAGAGQQTVFGGSEFASATVVLGNSGSLEFIGGCDSESVWLAEGNSTIFGGSYRDDVATGSGDAVVVTGSGSVNVWLQTGTADIFEEGGGAVLYGVLPNTPTNKGIDIIAGFAVGKDTLQVSTLGPETAASLIAGQQHYGGNTLLTLPNGARLELVNIGSVDSQFFS